MFPFFTLKKLCMSIMEERWVLDKSRMALSSQGYQQQQENPEHLGGMQ